MTDRNQPPPIFSLKRGAPLLVLIAGLIGFFAFGLDDYLTLSSLREHRDTLVAFAARYGLLANLAYAAVYAVVVAFSLPVATLFTLVSGFLFGTLLGGATAVLGATIGASLLFLAAKTSIGDALEARAGPAMKKMEAGFQKNAFSYLLFLRLVPLFPFFLVNLAPAFLGIRLRTFFITTFFGIMPGGMIYASAGNGLSAVLDSGADPNFALYGKPEILVPILGLAALSLIPIVYKKFRRSDGGPAGETPASE